MAEALRLLRTSSRVRFPATADVFVEERPNEIAPVSRQDFIRRSRIPGSSNSFVSLYYRAPRNPGVAWTRKTQIPHSFRNHRIKRTSANKSILTAVRAQYATSARQCQERIVRGKVSAVVHV